MESTTSGPISYQYGQENNEPIVDADGGVINGSSGRADGDPQLAANLAVPQSDSSPKWTPELLSTYVSPELVDELLGPFGFVPWDGRIGLANDRGRFLRHSWPAAEGNEPTLDESMRMLKRFDQEMRVSGDYCVMDSDPLEHKFGHAVYRLESCEEHDAWTTEWVNEKRKRPADKPPHWFVRNGYFQSPGEDASQIAPWRRLIFCQGLADTSSTFKPARNHRRGICYQCPYLTDFDNEDQLISALSLHLACQQVGGSSSSNPHKRRGQSFHITFFERLDSTLSAQLQKSDSGSTRAKWKIGTLYDAPENAADPDDQYSLEGTKKYSNKFRQSAFTMCTVEELSSDGQPHPHGESPYWTILLLSPSGFFVTPLMKNDLAQPSDWRDIGSQPNALHAELACIIRALREVITRWTQLYEYIMTLLNDADVMDLKQYVEALFDNADYDRSRRFFWIIGCLNEFDSSIGQNILQVELFREARIPAVKQPFDEVAEKARALDREVETLWQSLKDLRSGFRDQLQRAQTLRDGLLNASALMESRAATRLGRNVQLLTYVSIFYLPLAFCAALWAIPNILDRDTRNPFIITAVIMCCVTYLVVFNLNGISDVLVRKYRSAKKHAATPQRKDEAAARMDGPNDGDKAV